MRGRASHFGSAASVRLGSSPAVPLMRGSEATKPSRGRRIAPGSVDDPVVDGSLRLRRRPASRHARAMKTPAGEWMNPRVVLAGWRLRRPGGDLGTLAHSTETATHGTHRGCASAPTETNPRQLLSVALKQTAFGGTVTNPKTGEGVPLAPRSRGSLLPKWGG